MIELGLGALNFSLELATPLCVPKWIAGDCVYTVELHHTEPLYHSGSTFYPDTHDDCRRFTTTEIGPGGTLVHQWSATGIRSTHSLLPVQKLPIHCAGSVEVLQLLLDLEGQEQILAEDEDKVGATCQ